MSQKLQQLAQVVTQAESLEELTRPILALLQRLSGLESTYLTRIDEAADFQEILYAYNSGTLDISERVKIPWHDTLCQRALAEDQFLVKDVPARWSDCRPAAELGLHTYISVPVGKADGDFFGTLCGASCDFIDVDENIREVMQLFSDLISHQIARESQLNQQRHRADDAEARVAEMQLITDLSGQCLAATSLPPILDQTAQRLAARDTWPRVITFLIDDHHGENDGKLTLDHDDPDGILAGLISELLQKKQHLLMQPDAFLLLTDGDSSRLADCRHLFDLPVDGSSALITANDEDKVVGGIVLFGNRVIRTDGNESRLLRSYSNLLSLLATRLHDVELLQAANRQLAIDAMHDPLTGLPNRRYLLEEAAQMLSREARGGGALHVAFIDLDGFKKINDEHGHETGDAFLVAVAERLQSTARASDFIARYGGDEFVVVVTSGHVSNATDECYQVVNRLQSALSGRYELPDATIDYTGPSIGCVSCSDENADIDELLARADAAMYEVKQARRRGS